MNIRFYLQYESFVQAAVYTLDGRKIDPIIQQHFPSGEHETSIKIPNLSKGLYVLKLNVEAQGGIKTSTFKFNKQ